MHQVIRVAQQNREIIAKTQYNFNITDLKRKSHLIVRIMPDSLGAGPQNSSSVIDFVELCGSDLSATPMFASSNMTDEKDRKFSTTSFNAIS